MPNHGSMQLAAWCLSFVLPSIGAMGAHGHEPGPPREVIGGIMTNRVVPGVPYDLAGKRIVFTNWFFIQPGDLDWRNDEGKSVYVHGDSGVFDAHHVGINPPHGIQIRAEKPKVVGPFERPYRSLLQDGGIYKGWTSTEYFESTDGMHWDKKALLVLDELHTDGIHHVFIDPVAPPEERFKSVWTAKITRAEFEKYREKHPDGWEPRALFLLGEKDVVSCMRASVSPDGIRWKTLAEPLVIEYADTLNTAYYDSVLQKYVLYTRQWSVGSRTGTLPPDIRGSWTGVGRRAIGRSESDDFRNFSPSKLILEPGPEMLPSETLYTNCRTTVPGAPDQHLMFPAIWNASLDDTTRIAMATSGDGINWHWVPGGDLLRTASFGQWDGGCIWANPDLLELPSGDWALPYAGHNVPHKYPRGKRVGGLGYAVWPKGRMVALEAKDQGEFTMMPVVAPGRTLKINADTLRTGWVKVAVLDVSGRTIEECVPVVGDQMWTTVAWKNGADLGREAGQSVTLRFQLRQAKLYGIEFH